MQPVIGHGGFAPSTYSYTIFKNAIQWAFEFAKRPIAKLSPWPYPYNAAINFRHDMEAIPGKINAIEGSAQYEAANGVRGDYYFCTGALRNDYGSSEKTAEIASLQRAVANDGAMVSSHNGGLTNIYPFNPPLDNVDLIYPSLSNWYTDLSPFYDDAPPLTLNDYEYWHWGPDEEQVRSQ